MDHDLEITIPILELLEIEVFIVPGILEILGIVDFPISPILEIFKVCFLQFLIWWKYGRRAGGSRGQAPGAWIIF